MRDEWNTTAGRKVRAMCWKRDREQKARCWICGGVIDYTLKPSSTPEAWEPDHVLPRVRHPRLTLDPTNIKAAHRKCNRSRHDRATLHGLGKPSREW